MSGRIKDDQKVCENHCPNCGAGLKKACTKCKKSFPNVWSICPFCGKEHKDVKKTKAKSKKPTGS